jgi:hypothetical protein
VARHALQVPLEAVEIDDGHGGLEGNQVHAQF